jgi:hypothetical protein
MTMRIDQVIFVSVCTAVLAFAGCNSKPPAPPVSTSTPSHTEEKSAAETVPDAATITGKVLFEGTAPKPEEITLDEACQAAHSYQKKYREDFLVNENKTLRNCFVYIKSGIDKTFDPPSEPFLLDQKGCDYIPRVFGVQVGQRIQVRNSDAILHNVRGSTHINKVFNFMQPKQGQVDEKIFDKPEVMVQFKCDVHPWMSSWCGVLPHPYFAVTGEDGTFTIKNLPPGTYTLEAWHEVLGRKAAEVTVAANETKEIEFQYTR